MLNESWNEEQQQSAPELDPFKPRVEGIIPLLSLFNKWVDVLLCGDCLRVIGFMKNVQTNGKQLRWDWPIDVGARKLEPSHLCGFCGHRNAEIRPSNDDGVVRSMWTGTHHAVARFHPGSTLWMPWTWFGNYGWWEVRGIAELMSRKGAAPKAGP